ncbi:pentatricopeptide repeat-containing protein At5g27110 [Selaginella moellendorffii]|uniref:pentatricopeptide repeat-containing protein At5g27110 n=1 Tax=Selaginella moellendorffii TaxID=88036 RepID=UPI000D1C7CD8|nr:pentatricopeptide repeat-containing protein At5g27110 [Selaginella moellendorffii]|eukprot:XP_024537716.1 pentatricopeptide repeat-containing protein At5g27110 [Selaginella moellendorffii]
MYAKCGSMVDARKIFETNPRKSVVSWNALILGYAENGDAKQALDLFSQMESSSLERSCRPNRVTYLAALKACANLASIERGKSTECLEIGRRIHSQLVESGLELHTFVASTLIDTYGKCGSMVDARSVFDRMKTQDVVSWSSMILGYAESGRGDTSLELLERMRDDGVRPNAVTYLAALKACANFPGDLSKARDVHSGILRSGSESNGFVANALVDLYGKVGSMTQAQLVFDGIAIAHDDAASWNALILGYAEGGDEQQALETFESIERLERSNAVTYLAALKACVNLAGKSPSSSPSSSSPSSTSPSSKSMKLSCLRRGRAIHSRLKNIGQDHHLFLSSTLIDLYGKCGSVEEAKTVFDSMDLRDVFAWTAMISAYVEGGENEQALALFARMELAQIPAPPSPVTYLTALKACANLGALAAGRSIHAKICRRGFEGELLVTTALIDFYGRSGSSRDAEAVFDAAAAARDLAMWNALVGAHSHQGKIDRVLDSLQGMEAEQGLRPNGVTFVSILAACGHAGLVDQGRQFFREMRDVYGIVPSEEHISCVVDLLCRANRLDEALEMLECQRPRPGFVTLMGALGGCRKWGNARVARAVFDLILGLEIPEEDRAAATLLMASVCGEA